MKTQIINRIAALLVPVLAAIGLSFALPSVAAQPESPTIWLLKRPCNFEDSSNCYWDAGQGNGTGHSFVSRYVRQAQLTCIFYTDKGYARTHDRCIDEGYNPRQMQDLDGDGYGAERA
jgi:hypothetical protein